MHTLVNAIFSTARQLHLLRGCQLFVLSGIGTLNIEIAGN